MERAKPPREPVVQEPVSIKGKRAWVCGVFPVLLLLLSVLGFFSHVLLSQKSLFGSDFVLQFSAWKGFLYHQVRANGTIPFWNPYLFSGMPFIANIQASMFYPLGILYYLLPPERAYLFTTVIHCMLGCSFMYYFVRGLGVSVLGASISALVFTYNGFFVAHLYAGHLSFVQNYIWIPLLFMLQFKSFQENQSLRWTIAAGLVLGIQILGGFPQIAFYTIIALTLHGVYRFAAVARKGPIREAMTVLARVAVTVLIGFALAAVQVLPTAEFTTLSTRAGGISYAFATDDSLHPLDLLSFLLPDLFGNILDGTYWRSAEGWHFWESCAYVGTFPLLLLLVPKAEVSTRSVRWFFGSLSLLALFLALGKHNPLYPLFYHGWGLRYFRIPSQILFLYVFGVAVTAGVKLGQDPGPGREWGTQSLCWLLVGLLGAAYLGTLAGLQAGGFSFVSGLLRALAESPGGAVSIEKVYARTLLTTQRVAVLFLLGGLVLLLKRRGLISFSGLALCGCLILLADLWSFGRPFVQPYETSLSERKQRLLASLPSNPVDGRVLAPVPLFNANDGLTFGFPSILGYDPLTLKRYVHFVQASQDEPVKEDVVQLSRIRQPFSPLLALLNLTRIVLPDRVITKDSVAPYAVLVARSRTLETDHVLPFMKGPDFDPQKMVVLEPSCTVGLPAPVQEGKFRGSWAVEGYAHEEIRMRVSASAPCFLVLSEVFYPGWMAQVDGKKTPLFRGNYLFRVLRLDEGDHLVVLRFVSWPFRLGAGISLGTLFLCLMVLLKRKKIRVSSERAETVRESER